MVSTTDNSVLNRIMLMVDPLPLEISAYSEKPRDVNRLVVTSTSAYFSSSVKKMVPKQATLSGRSTSS